MAPALTGAIFFRAGTQRICFFDKDRGAEVFVRACGRQLPGAGKWFADWLQSFPVPTSPQF
ncbi:hypothetical protein XFF6990_390087 [Xanthomonas citri pv. fuscans]|uniref:Uncharacterized protein n=1 Tax=Xanthomonas campestris pv. phaseoli TaxID=317013 RepID=A0A7Z7IZT9_XANCH|nr:hypothetical protein XFF6990_390087 [Xanthomonas citri pv. fuscans]SOO23515.1 hypothetical protein XFF6991_280174 [Xanthomonas phaseoli pv. phaseoli]